MLEGEGRGSYGRELITRIMFVFLMMQNYGRITLDLWLVNCSLISG